MTNFRIPLGETVNNFFDEMIIRYSSVFDSISDVLRTMLKGSEEFLLMWPPWFLITVFSLLVFLLIEKKLGLFTVISLIFMYGLDLWPETVSTLALILAGTFWSLAIGVPTGILASQYDTFEKILRPILDFMQTLPSFVYLIPAVIFFGLGKVSGLVATLIFAMPPAIRLTNLGIRQVPADMMEAAKAFGSTRWQILTGIQLPLALPTIMAGVNQCIMMALSMSVIAAMIGAGGLGRVVLMAMETVNIGKGVEGGIGIVLLAILLDRVTENISKRFGAAEEK
ncbi:MAG: glycine/betaine ABC transporter [Firmicutes bacterium HGW-Firmicutes-14]|nr:MAG: glycine/betaine ABC transporter [Firmicutes bacterium HGW-Firmicutes-14]